MIGVWKKDAGWNEAAADYAIDELDEVNRIVQELNA